MGSNPNDSQQNKAIVGLGTAWNNSMGSDPNDPQPNKAITNLAQLGIILWVHIQMILNEIRKSQTWRDLE